MGKRNPSLLHPSLDFTLSQISQFRPPSAPETKLRSRKGLRNLTGLPLPYRTGSKCLHWEIKPNRQNQTDRKIFQNVFTDGLSATGRFSRLLQKSVSERLLQWKIPSVLSVPKNPAVGPGSLKFSDPRAGPRSLYIFGGWCVCRESFRPKRNNQAAVNPPF